MKIIIFDCTDGEPIPCSSFEEATRKAEELRLSLEKDKQIRKALDPLQTNAFGDFVPYVITWR